MNPLADHVRAERLRRRWSVRDAAVAGKISNTWWAKFEDGLQPLTDGIVAAVALAFGWSADWATQPVGDDQLTRLVAVVAELSERVDGLAAQVVRLGGEVVPTSRRAARPDAQSTGD